MRLSGGLGRRDGEAHLAARSEIEVLDIDAFGALLVAVGDAPRSDGVAVPPELQLALFDTTVRRPGADAERVWLSDPSRNGG